MRYRPVGQGTVRFNQARYNNQSLGPAVTRCTRPGPLDANSPGSETTRWNATRLTA